MQDFFSPEECEKQPVIRTGLMKNGRFGVSRVVMAAWCPKGDIHLIVDERGDSTGWHRAKFTASGDCAAILESAMDNVKIGL